MPSSTLSNPTNSPISQSFKFLHNIGIHKFPKASKVDVPDFDGKLNPESYINWIVFFFETFFKWKEMLEETKVDFVATKLKSHALLWWQQYQLR